MCFSTDTQFQNVLLLSLSFMLVFTAFQTMGNIEKTVLQSIAKDDPSFKGDGYTSLAVIYAVFSICNWLAPSIVAVCGAKYAMLIGAILYTCFIASFLYPLTWLLYVMSTVLGIAAAIIWTAQGNYLTECSTDQTRSRNTGIFWAILQSSMFLGNSFVSWQFDRKTDIDLGTRQLVFSVLTGVAIIGVACLCCLRKPLPNIETEGTNRRQEPQNDGAMAALKKAIKLFVQKDMILLSFTFFYTGIELSFFSGVYSSSIGFTMQLGEQAKKLVGLCGILVGSGEVIAGALFGLLGSKTVKGGRDPIVLTGFLCHTLSFYLIFINLPNQSPLGSTFDLGYISPPSAPIALFCAFLLGFGDACFNTQIYSILGGLYPSDSAPAFALFKFTQSAAAAASFFYSSAFSLTIQLLILQVFCVMGTITFFLVEWASVIRKKNARSPDTTICDINDEEANISDPLEQARNNSTKNCHDQSGPGENCPLKNAS